MARMQPLGYLPCFALFLEMHWCSVTCILRKCVGLCR